MWWNFTGMMVEVVYMDIMAYGFHFLLSTNEGKQRILMQIVFNYVAKRCV